MQEQVDRQREISLRLRPSRKEDSQALEASSMQHRNQANRWILLVARSLGLTERIHTAMVAQQGSQRMMMKF